ncbi:ATP-binding protein [Evansella sp. AB-rgal1]|uniref:ATP-binding protein n=1 Tax=Evansella sp. AB-rgal1 TaxID=3242696 RepID=UPI00359ED1FF
MKVAGRVDIIKDLVFNFSSIFVCSFFFLFLAIRKREFAHLNRKSLLFFSALAIILCITFPIHFSDGSFMDLRLVPIAIAGLYGGWQVSMILTTVLIAYRIPWGGEVMYLAILVAIFHGIIIGLISRWFLRLSSRNRILFSVVVGVISPLPTLLARGLSGNQELSPSLLVSFILIHVVAITFFVMLSESLIKVKSLINHVIHLEKMDIVNHVASSFTHEIRNPITTVKGFLQLMKSSDVKREDVDKYVSISINELDHAENIITEYLSFTKPSKDEWTVIDGENLLTNSIEVIRPLAIANKVEIWFNSVPFSVLSNKQKLQQAIINLFKNAIEAMPNGGMLSILVESNGSTTNITIRDTGIGMSEEQLQRLGEPYFSSKGDKGTGIGMMVVYNIVESVGGKIKVSSQVDKGTTFIISLPNSDAVNEPMITTGNRRLHIQ